jgi:putative acetyltransferase
MEQISTISSNEYGQIIELWELSVRATHSFLLAKDFSYYKNNIKKYFDNVNLYAVKNDFGGILGFMGISKDSIEMLFVHPKEMGKGIGKILINYAVNELKIKKVAVNEQNENTIGFYKKMGFYVINRSSLDSEGLPYPMLYMMIK